MQDQCSRALVDNIDLLAKLRQTEEMLKEVEDRLQMQQLSVRSQVANQQWEEQLKEVEKKVEEATERGAKVEEEVKKLEDRIMLAKIKISKSLDSKDNSIQ